VELVLEVDDLDAGLERIVLAGWPLEEDLAAQPWRLRDFRLPDPAGYFWRATTR
jgi:lactoylglutathione lyase